MSKKKVSTMTLRDFHGGSIPSDLPLPSAPGMIVERKIERPGSGGWHRGYGGDRAGFARQTSGNFSRSVDERVSYLPNPATIGKNYDEDERKPVEGHSRRGQVDSYEDSIYEHRQLFERLPERYTLENRTSYTSSKYIPDQRVERYQNEGINSATVAPLKPQFEDVQRRIQSPLSHGNHEEGGYHQIHSVSSGTGVQNVWTARKDVESYRLSPPGYNELGGDGKASVAGSRNIMQATALEKVSSGRWNSRILSPSNEPHPASEYAQSKFDGERYLTGTEAVHNENVRNEISRVAYRESDRAIDIPPSKDSRFEIERSDSVKYIDNRSMYAESNRKGGSAQRETEGALYNEQVNMRGGFRDSAKLSGSEPAVYAESRDAAVVTFGRLRPEPSPRRGYDESRVMDTTRDTASDYERRSFNSRDAGGISSHSESTYQTFSKEESGKGGSSLYLKSREPFTLETSDASKANRANDRSRAPFVSDRDQGQNGKLQSEDVGGPGLSTTSGASSSLLESESKNSALERPKLKLLPRTKPVEVDFTEEIQQEKLFMVTETVQSSGISPSNMSSATTLTTSGGPKSEDSSGGVERPKLSLKPRSQPVNVIPASGSVKERMSVFGGARPRELVLKERGVDESVIVGVDPILSPGLSLNASRTPGEANRTGGTEYSGERQDKYEDKKNEGTRLEQGEMVKQLGRNDSGLLERNESQGRRDRMDVDRREDRTSRYTQDKRDPERPNINKQESWRRTNDTPSPQVGPQSNLISVDGGSTRGSIPSAAELAKAFSRSTSFSTTTTSTTHASSGQPIQRSPMPRPAGPNLRLESPGNYKSSPRDVPFSRLTESLTPGPRDVYTQGGYKRANAF